MHLSCRQALTDLCLILGIHRSGTSLLTQGLVAAGAVAGEFNDFRDADNPEGYREHPQIRTLNNRLLTHLGASWDNWGFRASAVDFTIPTMGPWRDEAIQVLQTAFPGTGPFVLKDPRCATLLPFWQSVIPAAGFDLRSIVLLRDPVEVAESQMQRVARRPYEFPVIASAESMAALWSVTMQEVLTARADDRTLLVHHADLLADPANTLAAAAEFAGCAPSEDALAEFALNGVKPALYRARASDAARPVGPWMTAATGLFTALASTGAPRLLSRTEANHIAAAQVPLLNMMQTLDAARESIARLLAVHQAREAGQTTVLAELNKVLWAVNSGITTTPLLSARRMVQGMNDITATDNFAIFILKGRILMVAELYDQAEDWLAKASDLFRSRDAYHALMAQIKKLKGKD